MGRGASELLDTPLLAADSATRVRLQLFRSGSLEKVADYGPAQPYFAAADAVKPEGRVGRLEGLFCSATLPGLARWTNSNHSCNYDWTPQALRYDGPEPYAYPVEAWNLACTSGGGRDEDYEAYWAAGLPVSELLANPERYPSDKWELLVDPAHVTSTRPVSLKRLVEEAGDEHLARDLMNRFFRRVAFTGKIYGWPKNEVE